MSLDRIDNSKGYIPGNVAVISWRANLIKNSSTLEELEAVVAWLRVETKRQADSALNETIGSVAIVSPSNDSEKQIA